MSMLFKCIYFFLCSKWSNLANDTLHECFECDAEMSSSLLLMEHPYLNNMSCLEIAIDAGDKDFIGQQACQDLLDYIWEKSSRVTI